tara:strand:- start:1023 stop:1286 length:264 start_codon:yes stop_codon:yes gene_type:complete
MDINISHKAKYLSKKLAWNMTTKQTALNKIARVSTFDATCWNNSSEDSFTYCLDYLDLSLMVNGDKFCDKLVNRLEDKFEEKLNRPL